MMHANGHPTPKSGRQSLFFQDLATPISASSAAASGSKSRLSHPSHAAQISSLWKENFGGADLPPPPAFTLEDRSDFSPEPGLTEIPKSPRYSSPASPSPIFEKSSSRKEFATPISYPKIRDAGSPTSAGTSSWWLTPVVDNNDIGKGASSPVEGVVQTPKLLMLPPPREVARPEVVAKRDESLLTGILNDEEWVTVYGFSHGDTNLVLREFEKCGTILKHIPGPREANWMHILYQSGTDAQRAIGKNGMQINGVLIVGVKRVDPMQQLALSERINNQGFMTLPSSTPSKVLGMGTVRGSNSVVGGNFSSRQSGGAIASPAKSVVSKLFDVMFGV